VTPFLTLYTPYFKRPHGLLRNFASVQGQTIAAEIEQLVIPDHVGIGIAGMYARVPLYVDAVHGQYVAFLCDDDILAGPDVVDRLKAAAESEGFPPVLLVQTCKGGHVWPAGAWWPPRLAQIDLNCLIVRADIWKAHASDYGHSYEGDFAFAEALYKAGHYTAPVDLLFSIGAVSRGAAEAA